jgi:hypothetical protein
MLQVVQAVHDFSVAYPSAYFGSLLVVLLVVFRGWYVLGIGAGPRVVVPVRFAWKFTPATRLLLFQIADLVILEQTTSNQDTAAVTIALQVR